MIVIDTEDKCIDQRKLNAVPVRDHGLSALANQTDVIPTYSCLCIANVSNSDRNL